MPLQVSIFPAPVDERFHIPDVFVESRAFDFVASLEYKLVDDILGNLL
jgi:hypothetical protein